MIIEEMDISGLNLDLDLIEGLRMHMKRGISFLLAGETSYVVFFPEKMRAFSFYPGKETLIACVAATEFMNVLKITLVAHRQFIPAGQLIWFLDKKMIE